MQVQPIRATGQANLETIEEAVALYLEAYGKQFSGQYGGTKKGCIWDGS
jgi:hypothetical protein